VPTKQQRQYRTGSVHTGGLVAFSFLKSMELVDMQQVQENSNFTKMAT
jgi:hypothetical protein